MKLLTIQSLVCFVRERVSWGQLEKEVLIEGTVENDDYNSAVEVIKLTPKAVQDLIRELGIPNPADLKVALQDSEYWKKEYDRVVKQKNEQYTALLRCVEGKEPGLDVDVFLSGGQKIQAIKRIREVLDRQKIGLKEAKDIVDHWNVRMSAWGEPSMRANMTSYNVGNAEWPKNTTGKEVFVHLLAEETKPEDDNPWEDE